MDLSESAGGLAAPKAQLRQDRLFRGLRPGSLHTSFGSTSRSKIEEEASKTSPRLRELVGHATIFDNTARYILQHIDQSIIELDQMEPMLSEEMLYGDRLDSNDLDGLEQCNQIKNGARQASFGNTFLTSYNGHGQPRARHDVSVVVTTTTVDAGEGIFWDAEAAPSMDLHNGYVYLDHESWSGPSSKGTNCKTQANWQFLNASSRQVASSTLAWDCGVDDLLLWSQQSAIHEAS